MSEDGLGGDVAEFVSKVSNTQKCWWFLFGNMQ